MRILHIVGARPQFIKLAPLYNEMSAAGLRSSILHTGQHFDHNMSDIFFEELNIPPPDHNLGISSLSHSSMTSQMMMGIESVLDGGEIDCVIVYGDTNSTLAGALAARQKNIKLIHIESGSRNFDDTMPEEINRVIVDRISDVMFCNSERCFNNLKSESLWYNSKIYNCGDLMYDVLKTCLPAAMALERICEEDYTLVTIHRAKNTDNPENMAKIVENLNVISQSTRIVFPAHPRVRQKLLTMQRDFEIIEPVGYLQMLNLTAYSDLVITDSGGLVKEAYWLEKPTVSLLDNPVWPELVELGACFSTGVNEMMKVYELASTAACIFGSEVFGSGAAAKQIVEKILKEKTI
jgi:UDP-GlcNAc3NAcA epimerase